MPRWGLLLLLGSRGLVGPAAATCRCPRPGAPRPRAGPCPVVVRRRCVHERIIVAWRGVAWNVGVARGWVSAWPHGMAARAIWRQAPGSGLAWPGLSPWRASELHRWLRGLLYLTHGHPVRLRPGRCVVRRGGVMVTGSGRSVHDTAQGGAHGGHAAAQVKVGQAAPHAPLHSPGQGPCLSNNFITPQPHAPTPLPTWPWACPPRPLPLPCKLSGPGLPCSATARCSAPVPPPPPSLTVLL